MKEFAAERLSLTLSKCDLFPVSRGVDFLGYRHFPGGYMLLRKSTAKRIMRRLRGIEEQYHKGFITADKMRSVLASAKGWIKHANAFNLSNLLRIEELHAYADRECKRLSCG